MTLVQIAKRIQDHLAFSLMIVAVIILNAIIIGLETSPGLYSSYSTFFYLFHNLVLAIFVLEAVIKITACAPRPLAYFKDPWNVFDFTIIIVSFIPAIGPIVTIARLARLLRVLRLVSILPGLRLMVSTLLNSIPSMGNILILLGILFYMYAIAGYTLFHEVDVVHWGSLGASFLTLFKIVTLENWAAVLESAMAVYPWAWVYFVSFIILGTFIIINLFIAVVINNLQEAKLEKIDQLITTPSKQELIDELEETKKALTRLETRLKSYSK